MKGKCKQDFEKWCPNYAMKVDDDPTGLTHINPYYKDYFNELPHSMQWGVIVDFFRERLKFNEFLVFYSIYSKAILNVSCTPTKARAAAIEKATEIYNEKFADRL